MAAHRYWRIQIRETQAGYGPAIGELQMHTSIGGDNVAIGGTASASSVSGAFTAAKAFDGLTTDTDNGNGWYAASWPLNGFPWLQYDFGSGNSKDIQEIVIFCPGAGAGIVSGYMPIGWNFQWSDDGVMWKTQRAFREDPSAAAWTAASSRVYDVRELGAVDIHNYTLFSKVSSHPYVTPGQPTAPVYDPSTEEGKMQVNNRHRFAGDMGHPGLYKIAGTTTMLGNPAPRRVRLYNQFDGRIYAEQYTGADGLFEFRNLEIGPWTVVGVDDTGIQNGVIYSHVNAVPM